MASAIVDPSLSPSPTLLATRSLVVSHFTGDPTGVLYASGYDGHNEPAQNTAWIYRGAPGQ
jgi:hypothetical protein